MQSLHINRSVGQTLLVAKNSVVASVVCHSWMKDLWTRMRRLLPGAVGSGMLFRATRATLHVCQLPSQSVSPLSIWQFRKHYARGSLAPAPSTRAGRKYPVHSARHSQTTLRPCLYATHQEMTVMYKSVFFVRMLLGLTGVT